MNQEIVQTLLKVGKAFHIPGPFFSYEEIKMGNVNHTYKVNYVLDDGSGMAQIKSYLFQRVNTYAFRHPVELMENIDKVTEYIRKNNPNGITLHFHHTEERKTYLLDSDGFWRVCNFVPSVTFNSCSNLQVVNNTGEAFGDFQVALSGFDPSQLFYTIPDFHNTRKRYESLKAAIENDSVGRVKDALPEIEYLFSVQEKACELTDMFDRGELPLRVTHNDTKINNVLFDEKTLEPLVVIDLDTVMPGLVAHDFGDAIRFAANFEPEDSENLEKVGCDLNVFWAFTEGFLKKTAKTLTQTEVDTMAMGSFVLACELATRFLSDYLVGDLYFKTTGNAHNLIRTRCQIALAKDLLKKMDSMTAIVQQCAKKYQK